MIIRSLSALVMASFVLSAIWIGSPYFEALIGLIGCLAIMEWYRLILVNRPKFPNIIFMCFGVLYVLVPCLILVWLRNNGPHGLYFIVWFFVVIWSTDIGAYLFGKSIGGAKLAPKISPNKTWAGFFGGISSAVIVSFLLYYFLYPMAGLFLFFLGCVIISIVGQIGDLFESWCKRRLGVKDSGKLIPGHGGILDRVDSLLLSTPIAGVVAIIFQTHRVLF
jgi:phosphatidate cytidylyltransferase